MFRSPIIAASMVAFLALYSTVSARPTNLQEQNIGYSQSFLQGTYVGFQTLLALAGFYEEDEVKQGMAEDSELVIDAEDEEDQTEIKIVGLGLGRTGTTSLAMALEILGYTVVHDDEQTELTDLFDAEEEEVIDIDELHEILGLRGYNATFKTAGYNWVADNPDVKAILTVRDNPDKYVDSWLVAAPFIEILRQKPFCWLNTVEALLPSFEAEFMYETTGGKPEDFLNREALRQNYEQYVSKVQEAIPSSRLLTFNVKQGWGPLCEYLGQPVPKGIAFPHVHTRAKLEGEMFFLRVITWIWPLAVLAIVIPLLCIFMALKRKFSKSDTIPKSAQKID